MVTPEIGLFPASATWPEIETEDGTMKLAALVAVPSAVVTVIGPVVAPAGTVARICVVEFNVNVAFTPLNRTAVGAMKLVPSIVTCVPTGPVIGEKEEIVGVAFAVPPIKNPPETLKKTLPSASTLILDVGLGVPGIVTISNPSLGVSFARTIG